MSQAEHGVILTSVLAERDRSDGLVRAERARGPLKGFDFEARIAPVIDAAHAPHQDIVETTGRTRGVVDRLTGDFVAKLNPNDSGGRQRTVVHEAKDKRLSMA